MSEESSRLADALRGYMDELEAIVGAMSEAAASSRPPGGWSAKETLSHLQGAEGETFLDGINRIIREDEPAIDVTPGMTNYHADRQAASVERLLSAVLAQYRGIAEVLDRIDDETLARRAHIELLAGSPIGDRPTLVQWTAVIVDRHVAGHVAGLRAST